MDIVISLVIGISIGLMIACFAIEPFKNREIQDLRDKLAKVERARVSMYDRMTETSARAASFAQQLDSVTVQNDDLERHILEQENEINTLTTEIRKLHKERLNFWVHSYIEEMKK